MTQLELCNLALDKLGEPPITALGASTPAAQACTRLYQPTLDQLVRKYRWNFARGSVRLQQAWLPMGSLIASPDDIVQIATAAPHGLVSGQRINVNGTNGADGGWEIRVTDVDEFELVGSRFNSSLTAGEFALAPPFAWSAMFLLPTNCLSLRTVEGYEVSRAHKFFVLEGRHVLCNMDDIEITYTKRQVGGTDEAGFDTIFNNLFATMLAAELAMPVTGAMSRRGDMMQLYSEELANALMSNVFEHRDNLIDQTQGPTSAIARQYA
jgi:hypothetical protein